MKRTSRMPCESAFDDTAAEWVFERENGFTPERAKAFAAWCAADLRHAEAVQRIERTMALLDELPAVRERLEARLEGSASGAEFPAVRQYSSVRRVAWLGGMAAVLALAVGWWTLREQRAIAPVEHYATDTLAQRSIALPDGSVMDINVGSDVAVQFTANERRITLHKGEAHFQVAHNSARPFIVTAGNCSVRAVGTAFDVRLTSEAVDVVVVEGKVELGSNAGRIPTVGTVAPLLVAGERAQIQHGAEHAPKTQGLDERSIRSLLTWQTPMTSFTDVPLRDVIARFNRRNVVQLILADAELGSRKIGGRIALDQVDAFVRLLEQDGDIAADRTIAGEIALHRAR